jgi:signal peptidase I
MQAGDAGAGSHSAPGPRHSNLPRGFQLRRLVEVGGMLLIFLLIFRTVAAEPYGVPTGSMAPALFGNHKSGTCPRCGYPVRVGYREDSPGGPDLSHARCPNCGFDDLQLERMPVCPGDHLLVNKNVFSWRRPRRWEMAVFRCPVEEGKAFVKRVVGLPGEAVQVRDGDLYIDGELARKSLAEFKALRVPVFDNNYQPAEGWRSRWVPEPARGAATLEGTRLRLDGTAYPDDWQWLVYQNWHLDESKAYPVLDEYTYNGSDAGRRPEAVHDFMLECDVELVRGTGAVALGVTDGEEQMIAEVPAGTHPESACLFASPLADPSGRTLHRTVPAVMLEPGRRYHLELAFVDRRATLTLDGKVLCTPLDRPAADGRQPVERPVRVGARGAEVLFDNIRIFRDVHYTESGPHGVKSAVRLGAGQYFVLGDNSPNSDDNRFWSDAQDRPMPVPESSFLGKPFLVHMPSRMVSWDGFGQHWQYQVIDWNRIRWLR